MRERPRRGRNWPALGARQGLIRCVVLALVAAAAAGCGSERRAADLRDRTVRHFFEQPCACLFESLYPVAQSGFPPIENACWVRDGRQSTRVTFKPGQPPQAWRWDDRRSDASGPAARGLAGDEMTTLSCNILASLPLATRLRVVGTASWRGQPVTILRSHGPVEGEWWISEDGPLLRRAIVGSGDLFLVHELDWLAPCDGEGPPLDADGQPGEAAIAAAKTIRARHSAGR